MLAALLRVATRIRGSNNPRVWVAIVREGTQFPTSDLKSWRFLGKGTAAHAQEWVYQWKNQKGVTLPPAYFKDSSNDLTAPSQGRYEIVVLTGGFIPIELSRTKLVVRNLR